jgi:hypothetical protein
MWIILGLPTIWNSRRRIKFKRRRFDGEIIVLCVRTGAPSQPFRLKLAYTRVHAARAREVAPTLAWSTSIGDASNIGLFALKEGISRASV